MFTDMKTPQDTVQGFYAAHGADLGNGPTLVVKVLTTGSWPTQSSNTCNLPAEISYLCEVQIILPWDTYSLCKRENVLRKEPVSKDIGEDDAFSVNDKFISKLRKVKIGTVVAQKETEPEKQETRERLEEDRKPQIEAAIVRIMKSRRVLDHNNIISEVTKQLQSRFLANPGKIKKRIESLIDRDFLERDNVDRRLYRYLA
ncbi:UNVERIFIED_CONTAM: Cullin-3A [Sesamum latifolium]|uniref:Cullin-3A n=1 Tax=Sesamum latifolium TaxID=2727402 RepID=A0AAW2UVW4_9LAMI